MTTHDGYRTLFPGFTTEAMIKRQAEQPLQRLHSWRQDSSGMTFDCADCGQPYSPAAAETFCDGAHRASREGKAS